jgi:hypothetical protein
MELVVEHNVDGRGASRIVGWVPGETEAVITWQGTDDVGTHEYTEVITDQRVAMNLVADIEHYVNLELLKATLRPSTSQQAARDADRAYAQHVADQWKRNHS